ncbi:MAG: cyclase family protein [Candidatus Schekmanbacteria bacterium]|nr:cyclase family protein [Candidatus Schekmanbacteria bacterium]
MHIYDISVAFSANTPVYEGDPPIAVLPKSSIANGDSANVSLLNFGSHSATHIDAPYHFNLQGKTVDQIPLENFIGPAQVIEIAGSVKEIAAQTLENQVSADTARLLLKTSNSRLWQHHPPDFVRDFVHLSPEAALWLVKRRIKLIGIDYLSIERFRSPDHFVHHTLLNHQIVIVEGLNLSHVPAGHYFLVCPPLKIQGGDGAPVRAVLLDELAPENVAQGFSPATSVADLKVCATF